MLHGMWIFTKPFCLECDLNVVVIFHLWDLPSKPLMVALTKMKRVQECTLLLSLASLRGKWVCCDSSVFPNLLCCDQSTSWLLEFSLLVRIRRLELSCRFVACESTQDLVVFQGLNTLEGLCNPIIIFQEMILPPQVLQDSTASDVATTNLTWLHGMYQLAPIHCWICDLYAYTLELPPNQ